MSIVCFSTTIKKRHRQCSLRCSELEACSPEECDPYTSVYETSTFCLIGPKHSSLTSFSYNKGRKDPCSRVWDDLKSTTGAGTKPLQGISWKEFIHWWVSVLCHCLWLILERVDTQHGWQTPIMFLRLYVWLDPWKRWKRSWEVSQWELMDKKRLFLDCWKVGGNFFLIYLLLDFIISN